MCAVYITFVLFLAAQFSFAATIHVPADQPTIQAGIISENVNLDRLPLAFTQNIGQWPDSILYRADVGCATIWFTKNCVYRQFMHRFNDDSKENCNVLYCSPLVRNGS